MAVAFVAIACWWNPGLGYTDDDARMILEARDVLDGKGWPNHNSHIGMIALILPFCRSMVAMHMLMALTFGICVWLTWELLDGIEAMVAAALVATSPILLSYAVQVMTEVPFTAATLGALALARRKQWALALLVALVAVSIRSIGITLVAALMVSWLWSRRHSAWRRSETLLDLSIVAVACVAFYIARSTHGIGLEMMLRGGPYGPDITWWDFPGRIYDNLGAYLFEHIPFVLISWQSNVTVKWFAVVVLCLAVYGLRDRTVLIYCGLYLSALLVWPQSLGGTRYVVPLVPLLAIGVVVTVRDSRLLRVAVVPIAAVALLMSGYVFYQRLAGGPYVPRGYAQYFIMAENLRDRVPRGSVIVCRKSSAMRLLSGHHADMFPFVADPDSVRRWMSSIGATHVVLDQMGMSQTEKYLRPVVASREGIVQPGFKAIGRIDSTYLIAVR